MEVKPKAIKLTKLDVEQTPSGRKILHCIFKNRYGEQDYYYRWTPPWRSSESNIGVEELFLKALHTERWNDPDGAWSQELDAASKEYEALENVRPVIKVRIGQIREVYDDSQELPKKPVGWDIVLTMDSLTIDSDEEYDIEIARNQRGLYLKIGAVSIAWLGLRNEIAKVKGVSRISDPQVHSIYGPDGEYLGSAAHFWVRVGVLEKREYERLTKEIKYRINNYLCQRFSTYRMLEKGLED